MINMLKNNNKTILDIIILIIVCISIILLWQTTWLITIILLCLSLIVFSHSSKKDIIYFIIIAIFATIIESITISTGAWIYSTQNIINIPIWIPLYWGLGGIIMKDVYLFIKKKVN